MNDGRSPLAAGVHAALRHRRLAGVLWLSLFLSAAISWTAFRATFGAFDTGPFREALMKGWDSWAAASFLVYRMREIQAALPLVLASLVVGALLHVFLVGGLIRTLLADVARPVLRRVVADSAALFRPNLWAFLRYGVTLLFWEAVLVGGPLRLFKALGGKDAPPNGAWATLSEWWLLVVGLVVLLNVSLRFDLARIALAREDAPTARGAYRLAKQRLRGARPGAVLLALAWLVAGVAVQAVFTRLGVRMSPSTDGGVTALVVVRQIGFFVFAMTRIGFWGSLLAWEAARRPAPRPVLRESFERAMHPVDPLPKPVEGGREGDPDAAVLAEGGARRDGDGGRLEEEAGEVGRA